jgi:hypothetical protein
MAEWDPFEDLEALRSEVDRAFEGYGLGRQLPPHRVVFLQAGSRDDTH